MTIKRIDHRALPVGETREAPTENERRYRAAVEEAFAATDINFSDLSGQFLPLAGGTLTGDLTIDKEAAHITLKAPSWDADVSGSSQSAILLTDQNDAITARFGYTNTTAGVLRVENYVGQNVYTAAANHFHEFFVGTDKIFSLDERVEAFSNVYVTKSTPSLFLSGSGTKNLYFRNESDDNVGRVYYSTEQQSMRIISGDVSAANFSTYIFNNSSQARSASSVLRQSEGDTRYLRKDAVTGSFDVGGGIISNVNEIRVEDGSQTDPSFTFQSEQNTGLYLGSAGIAFSVGGVYAAILLEDGSATVSSNGIITREKGDARYSQTSSLRYKEEIDQNPVERIGVLDKLQVHTWRWGGETPQSNETFGTVGFGLIAEEVETIIPEAVTYRMVGDEEETSVRTINGLDPLALIAVLVEEVQVLVEEVQVLRAEVDILKGAR